MATKKKKTKANAKSKASPAKQQKKKRVPPLAATASRRSPPNRAATRRSGGDTKKKKTAAGATSLEALRRENEKLRRALGALESDVDRQRHDRMHLQEKVGVIEREAKRLFEQYVDVEVQNSNVANLYVASMRLHDTLDREAVLEAIQEIVINLVGSEELVVYEKTDDATHLVPIRSFGLAFDSLRAVRMGEGIIGRCGERGEAYVAKGGDAHAHAHRRSGDSDEAEKTLTACLPLVVGGKVTGVLAIHRLLEHKRALEDIDQELFRLLRTQAAMALYCTKLAKDAGVS